MKLLKIRLINLVKELDPPLGLCSIATYTREKLSDKIDISIIDTNFDNPIDRIRKDMPDIIGISAMTVYFNTAKILAQKIKEINKDIIVVIGGVHISTHKPSFEKCFDIAVIGEGEETFYNIIKEYMNNNMKLNYEIQKNIKGILFWNYDEMIETQPRELIENLDDIPYPDRSFLSKKYFKKNINRALDGKYVMASTMMTGRGCPFKCVFCSTSLFWKKVRLVSPKRFADEVQYLHNKYNVKLISIWDDLFGIT